ncbi:hypothetical protein [Ralstonia mannitolilytica]|uniref:hypothetical protein n=1 Tax=Ralstonia mannitolilytica TaxID=105219 RepID=UPI0012E88645|nr:hypothetical protein [Ralstonia mannitolilytica]
MFRVGAGVGQVTGRKKKPPGSLAVFGICWVLLFLLQAPLSFRQRCEMPKVKVKKLGEGHGENAKDCSKNQGSATAPHQSNRLYKRFS